MQEVVDAIADEVFLPLGDRPLYAHDGAEQLQRHLRQFPRYSSVVVASDDLVAVGRSAVTATREQWAFMESIRALVPDATINLRRYDLSWARDTRAPKLTILSVIVVKHVGVLSVRRELAAPVANEVSHVA
jgi:hypothetical protein